MCTSFVFLFLFIPFIPFVMSNVLIGQIKVLQQQIDRQIEHAILDKNKEYENKK